MVFLLKPPREAFLAVDGAFSQLYLGALFPLALCCRIEAMAAAWGSDDASSDVRRNGSLIACA